MTLNIGVSLPDDDDSGFREIVVGSLKIVIYPEEISWCSVFSWSVTDLAESDDYFTSFAPSVQCAEFCARLTCHQLAQDSGLQPPPTLVFSGN